MTTHMETVKKFTEIPRNDRRRYVDCIPLPTTLKTKVVHEFDSWVSNNGVEWAVGRMKDFRQHCMLAYSGDKSNHLDWFATNRHGALTGTFGHLYKLSQQSYSSFRAVLNLCGIYSTWSYASVDPNDLRGDLDSVVEPGPKVPRLHTLKVNTLKKYLRNFGSPSVRLRFPEPLTEVPPGKPTHKDSTPYDVWMISHWVAFTSSNVRTLLEKAVGGDRIHTPLFKVHVTSIEAGEIHATMEPGLKTRYFASPNKALQRASEPLKEALFDVIKRLPWDCTLNQRKADKVISQALRSGQTVYSVDLSSATDRFPYWFQKKVLQALKPTSTSKSQIRRFNGSSDLLDLIVEKGNFRFFGKSLRWSVGQPLGLNPSFPLFTISHGVLLLLLNNGNWKNDFYVVGDDVVILNKDLYRRYRNILNSWQIPVSDAKSFASSTLAQFAGVTYTPHGSFWLPKWRAVTRDTLVDVAAFWYKGFTKGMKDELLIERVLSLPEPFGIGRNPLGLPLSERLKDEVIDELVEKETVRNSRPKPSHTKRFSYDVKNRDYSYSWKQDWQPHSPNRRVLISPLFDPLMDLTEVTGYPRLRLRVPGNRDPYTLGRTQYWNLLFRKLESKLDNVVPPS